MTRSHRIQQEAIVSESNQHSDLATAIALADEIESAEKELLDSGWGGYPWEHLGDASRDISKLIRGLREASGLQEQLQTAEKERDEWEERYEELLSAVGGVWPG